jgi:hypothetical protein
MYNQLRTACLVCALGLLTVLPPPGRGDDRDKPAKKAPPAAPKEAKLRLELLERRKEDQAARKRLVELRNKQKAAPTAERKKEVARASKKVQEVDGRNIAWMKKVLGKHGWPGKALVGPDGADAAWLLAQHADSDRAFQRRCLRLLARAVKKGHASPPHLAYLTDRVRVGAGRKQVYGTQFREVDGKMEPYPIEDEASVDMRRKEAGLPSLAAYRKMVEAMYKPGPKARPDK